MMNVVMQIPKEIPKKVCIQKAQFCNWAEFLFFLISEQALIHTRYD